MLFPVIDVVETNQARFLDTFKDIEILNYPIHIKRFFKKFIE